MNGGNRLEDLIRGGHQQPVESETTEYANNAAGSRFSQKTGGIYKKELEAVFLLEF